MNTVLVIKWIDLLGQILMLFPLVAPVEGAVMPPVLQTYFSVGSWQVLSLILHFAADPAGRARRASYARVLGLAAAIAALAFACMAPAALRYAAPETLRQFGGGLLILLLAVLVLTAPVLAVWYFVTGLRELRLKQLVLAHRREIHWKL